MLINTPTQLKDHILRRLGAPVVNVELTEIQILDCIDRALELYGEYHYDGLHRTYHIFYAKDNDEYKHGIYSLKGQGIFAITNILRANMSNIMTMDVSAVYPWFQDFVLGLAGTGAGGCNSYSPNSFGGDLSYYSLLMSYRSELEKMMNPVPDFFFNADTEMVQFNGIKKGEMILVEAYTKAYVSPYKSLNTAGSFYASGVSSLPSIHDQYNNPISNIDGVYAGEGNRFQSGSYNNRWVKNYATSLAKELNGYILSKHQGMSLPGGVTVDGVRIIEEAKQELEKLMEELYLLSPPIGILIG